MSISVKAVDATAFCLANCVAEFDSRKKNQRSLRDSPILHRVCVGEMLLLKAICDALTH